MSIHPVVQQVTQRIEKRSQPSRGDYLAAMEQAADAGPWKATLSCGNLAHAFAAGSCSDKDRLTGPTVGNIGIVTAYNDMLSAHQPFLQYPDIVKRIATEQGATAQVAGGVPAMCDGVTQGQPGMELSLFSRDVIALSTAVALTHNVFDAAVFLGKLDP